MNQLLEYGIQYTHKHRAPPFCVFRNEKFELVESENELKPFFYPFSNVSDKMIYYQKRAADNVFGRI